jgi:hypothetical protein
MSSKEPSPKYWNGWYLLVLVVLVAEILFFSWLTDFFN